VISHAAAHLALRVRLLTVAGLPASRAFENKAYTPTAGTPYLTDAYVPSTLTMLSFPAKNGTVEETGLYVVQWFGLHDAGFTAIRAGMQAILAAFAPGTSITSNTGDVIRIRTDVGPMAGEITPLDSGWSVCIARIPWRAHSANVIAA
jgi:hypothetical protein